MIFLLLFLLNSAFGQSSATVTITVTLENSARFCSVEQILDKGCVIEYDSLIQPLPVEDYKWYCWWVGPGWAETKCGWLHKDDPLPLIYRDK